MTSKNPAILWVLALILTLAAPVSATTGDDIEITNKEGKTLKVTLVQLKDGVVRFRRAGSGKEYSAPLISLDNPSQSAIKRWKEDGGGLSTEFRITAKVVRANLKSKIENYDDRLVKMAPTVIVQNADPGTPSGPLKATMLLLGRQVVGQKHLTVLSREEKKIEPLDAHEKQELTFPLVEILYDNKHSAKYGSKYYGYVFLLQKGDEIVASSMQPGHLTRKGDDLFLRMKKGKFYDDSLLEIK